MFVAHVKKFPQGISEMLSSHARDEHKAAVTLTFDLRPPKSNQFILESERTFVQSLKKIPQSIFEISRSQE